MNIILKFDYYSKAVYIPDGYILNMVEVQNNFFEWLYEQSGCFVKDNNENLVISYNEEEFLQYINDVILVDSQEKAYFITNTSIGQGKIITLQF